MCDSTSSGFSSEAGSVRIRRASRPRPPPVSDAVTKRREIDFGLQHTIGLIQRELKKVKDSSETANDIEKGVAQMNKWKDSLRCATSNLITQVEENGGFWEDEWPNLSPANLQSSFLSRANEADLLEEKAMSVIQNLRQRHCEESKVEPFSGAQCHTQTVATEASPKSGWLRKLKALIKPKARNQNQESEVTQLLQTPEIQTHFTTKEGQEELEKLKMKARGNAAPRQGSGRAPFVK